MVQKRINDNENFTTENETKQNKNNVYLIEIK